MNKRRLSKQQQRRISGNQQRAVEGDEKQVTHDNCNGRVISHFGQQLHIEPLDSLQEEPVLCHQRANLPALVTGDKVVFEQTGIDTGVVTALGQRANLFSRPDARGRERPVAANIDTVLVVIAAVPEPFPNLIDRYLVAIENLKLKASLVLNKVDLLDKQARAKSDEIIALYTGLDYPVFEVSAETGVGIGNLEGYLQGKTAVFVGQSGVGKSSLINELGHGDLAAVGSLSVGKEKGTHTTTTARLFHLPQLDVIDSPGIREFLINHLEPDVILSGFRELREIAGHCKFRNCSHGEEPQCAIRAALQAGEVNPLRWQSYQQILRGNETVKNRRGSN